MAVKELYEFCSGSPAVQGRSSHIIPQTLEFYYTTIIGLGVDYTPNGFGWKTKYIYISITKLPSHVVFSSRAKHLPKELLTGSHVHISTYMHGVLTGETIAFSR